MIRTDPFSSPPPFSSGRERAALSAPLASRRCAFNAICSIVFGLAVASVPLPAAEVPIDELLNQAHAAYQKGEHAQAVVIMLCAVFHGIEGCSGLPMLLRGLFV